MKKLLFFTAILSTQLIHASLNDTEGVLRTIYAPHAPIILPVLVTVIKNPGKKHPTITVEHYSDEKYNNAPLILSATGLQKYQNEISAKVRVFGRRNA